MCLLHIISSISKFDFVSILTLFSLYLTLCSKILSFPAVLNQLHQFY
jgi:hypothetical protein